MLKVHLPWSLWYLNWVQYHHISNVLASRCSVFSLKIPLLNNQNCSLFLERVKADWNSSPLDSRKASPGSLLFCCYRNCVLVQSQLWKNRSNLWNLFKVKDNDRSSGAFLVNYERIHTLFHVSFVNFERVLLMKIFKHHFGWYSKLLHSNFCKIKFNNFLHNWYWKTLPYLLTSLGAQHQILLKRKKC